MSIKRARHATTAERVIAHIDAANRALIIAAAIIIAAVGGAWFGLSIPAEPELPPVIRVVVQPEPQTSKAQADAEIEAYNRGMDAGKFIGCGLPEPAEIERNLRGQ